MPPARRQTQRPFAGRAASRPGDDLVEREAERAARARRGERVDDVVAAGEGEAHGALLAARRRA